jgi:hypothetical protein
MDCKDTEGKFLIESIGEAKGCWWAGNGISEGRCDFVEVKINCAETCGLCSTGTSTGSATECVDTEERFYIQSIDASKYCSWGGVLEERCDIVEVKENCPVTCNLCNISPTQCADTEERFYIESIDASKFCSWGGVLEERCDIVEVQENCPVTCNLCNTKPPFMVGPISVPQRSLEIAAIALAVLIICSLACVRSGGGSDYDEDDDYYYDRPPRKREKRMRNRNYDDYDYDYRPRSGGRKSNTRSRYR